MSAPQFTPGPWEVAEGDSVVRIESDGGAVAATDTKPYYKRFDQTDLANARLIAAAPELYAELQQFVNGVETRMIDSPADETLANITRRAKYALAKARGEAA